VIIFPGGFKQFYSTLTKTRILVGLSSGHPERLPVQSRRVRNQRKV